MWNTIVIVLCLIVSNYAADHNLYKNCSRVELCSQRRELARQNRYAAALADASYNENFVVVPLTNIEGGDDLLLNITAIEGNIFRVEIEEKNSTRYHLEHVLDGEPSIISFNETHVEGNTSITIIVGSNRVYIQASPFSIEFYNNEILQLVLEGDRITLENNELSHPFTFGINFPQALHMYGLHEHADHVALRTTAPEGPDPYRVRTMDLTNYELYTTMAMYGAIPVLYGHGLNTTSGVFLHNAAEEWVEITNNENGGGEAYFMVDSGAFDLFVLLGPSVVEVVREYTSLTGVAHLPQLWTLGYHQCRWGYADIEDVKTVIADLDAYDFPVDVIWLDIQHTDNMKFFTWNPENFSDPFDMLNNLSSTNRYLVTLSDPQFKKEEGYFVYDTAVANDYFIKNPNGTIYEDQGWPGTSCWMDYLNPDARTYVASLYSYESWNGTTPTLGGIWNDMNEAAIFNDANEKTFPYDVVHYGGVSNREIHNAYGFLQTMTTHKGLMDRDNNELRPFILTRAHFAGSQRYAAFWTGDNTAEWGFIPISYSMCLTANILGISFCGADVGGFFGEPSDELLQRFYQAGAWLPFFREHSNIGSERREPYLYPESAQQVMREAIKMRYAHLPVWYTLFYEHTRYGDPVIRPLFYHYPNDPNVLEIDDQLLVGSDILVKPVSEPGATSVQVYFPGGENLMWFSAHELGNVSYPGNGYVEVPVTIDRIPVFYRQGSIIATKMTSRPSTTAMKDDEYTIIVLHDEDFSASGTVYIDDTHSFKYRDSLEYNYISLVADGLIFNFSSVDDSNSEGFELKIAEIIILTPEKSNDGDSAVTEYVKTVYKQTSNGIPLNEIKFNKKGSTVIQL